MSDAAVGAWNERQTFNDRGQMFLICTLNAGGYAVCRFEKADPGHAVVAIDPVQTIAEAVECAKRLTRSAMT